MAGKTVLVYDEQGFGDVFLFMRYLPQLKKAGAHLVLETRPALVSIFKSLPHIDELVMRHPSVHPNTACDYCIPLASLPGRLGTRLTTIPADVPYLHADPGLIAHWARRMAKGAFKIGAVWSGSNLDPSRNLDLALLSPLAEVKEIAIYGLQKQPASEVSRTVPDCPWMDNLGPELRDFSDTAAVIANCDLILAIDTAAAHLAGAMAAPTWVLLPCIPDWRWFLNRDESPWYPTMRLFRQHHPGQWTLPVCRVLSELRQFVARKLTPLSSHTTPKVANRKTAETFYYQAQSLQQDGRIDQAIDGYEKAIEADPALMEAHYNLGVQYYQQSRWTEAAACFQTALAIAPDFAHAAYNLAATYDKSNLRSAAIAAYRQTLAIKPTFASAAYNLGLLLFGDGRHPDAVEAFRKAVTNDPNHYQAYNNLGLACHHAGWLDEAIKSFEEAIQIKPDFVPAYHNLGNVYMDRDQWDRTIYYYREALDYNYQDPIAHQAMGKLYLESLDFDNARLHFEKALTLQPNNAEANCDLAYVCLMQEDYLEGWKHLHWRFKCTDSHIRIYPYKFNLPAWDGARFENQTLLVHCEQGLGDTIQFARFIPLVKSLGGQVLLQVQPALQPLFHGFPGVDQLLALTDRQPSELGADMVIPLMSIPECLRITTAKISNKVPYLYADVAKAKQWQSIIHSRTFNIGVVWAGNPIQVTNPRRTCRPDDFLSISRLPGVRLYSLQKNRDTSEYAHLVDCGAMIHLGDHLKDFGDTAAAISNMDLIITVDTSVAHLAGAMGHPVWILLCHRPDWRWGLKGAGNDWYPSARLFRQPKMGAWEPLFEMVRDALVEHMASSIGKKV
ncbi:MAG: tetratricopeptide repeat protein [Desulfatitalea sp.]